MEKLPLHWIQVGGILFLTWIILHWKKAVRAKALARRIQGSLSLDPLSIEIAGKIFTVAIVFVSLLLILEILGLDVMPLLTFSGIGAAALAFASRDVIANFFGGLMIYLSRPFTVGDFVELPGKKIQGNVEEIGWYFTSIRDLHKRPLYIPNSVFSTEFLLNHSRMTHRWIEEKIRIRSVNGDKAEEIIEAIRQLLAKQAEIDHQKPIHVFLLSIGLYVLEIEVKAYTLATQYERFMEIKQTLLLEIYQIIQSRVSDGALGK